MPSRHRVHLPVAQGMVLAMFIAFGLVAPSRVGAGFLDDPDGDSILTVSTVQRDVDDATALALGAPAAAKVSVDARALEEVGHALTQGAPAVAVRLEVTEGMAFNALLAGATPRWSDSAMDVQPSPGPPDGHVLWGIVVNEEQVPIGYVTLVTQPHRCLARINVPAIGAFCIAPNVSGDHVAQWLPAPEALNCGAIEWDAKDQRKQEELIAGKAEQDNAASCDDGTIIDLLVVYTPEARSSAAERRGGSPTDDFYIKAEIDAAVSEMNQAMQNSLVMSELRLLYKGEVSYTEPSPQVPLPSYLVALQGIWDGALDSVHPLRDAMRADLVCLICKNGTGVGGVANIMREETPAYESQSFAVVKQFTLDNGSYTFAHEIAHVLGCSHDPQYQCGDPCPTAPPISCWGLFEYSHGYAFQTPEGGVSRTILAIGPGSILHYSNPDVMYTDSGGSAPTGSVACKAQNAQTMNQSADTAAGLRISADTGDTTVMASMSFPAIQGNDDSVFASVSADGKYVAFETEATNFATIEANGDLLDVFIYNREAAVVRLVSHSYANPRATGNGASFDAATSGNGRYVAFASDATNLVSAPDGNGVSDVFVFDASPGASPIMRLISTSAAGGPSNGASRRPAVSQFGTIVAFETSASNVYGEDTNGAQDVVVLDWATGVRDVASFNYVEGQVANGPSFAPSMSLSDGRYVAFASDASNLLGAGGDGNAFRDVFVFDRTNDMVVRASVDSSGGPANAPSQAASISGNGRYVAFESTASDLVAGVGNGFSQVFVRDLVSNSTICISASAAGTIGDGDSGAPAMSADGQFVAFHSSASNLLPSGTDSNDASDVFVKQVATGAIVRASLDSFGDQAVWGGDSACPAVSADGRFICFHSEANNLAPSDSGAFLDIFIRDRGRMVLGDLSGDGAVNAIDEDILRQNWSGSVSRPCCAADLNGDGVVDGVDLGTLLANWTP